MINYNISKSLQMILLNSIKNVKSDILRLVRCSRHIFTVLKMT